MADVAIVFRPNQVLQQTGGHDGFSDSMARQPRLLLSFIVRLAERWMVTRQQITSALATRSSADLWDALLGHVRTLQPFWANAVSAFAARTALPNDKRDRYLGVIGGAFDQMDQWRRGTAKYVKARRNDIDGAISYLRNKAIEAPNRRLRFAPAARNAAGALRVCLTVSVHSYNDTQLADIVAGVVFDLAAVRTLFPFDFGNLMGFHPGHDGSSEDPFAVTLQRAGRAMGIAAAVDSLLAEVDRIWEAFGTPSLLEFSEHYWTAEGDDADARLRSAAIVAFHRRG
jgi:hypothetical protein